MKVLAAYLLLAQGGNTSPSASDITTLLSTVGIEAEESRITSLISELEGKDLNALIQEGVSKMGSVPSGGAAPAAGGSGAAAPSGGAAPAEEKKEEKAEEKEESDEDVTRPLSFEIDANHTDGIRSLRLNLSASCLPIHLSLHPNFVFHPVLYVLA